MPYPHDLDELRDPASLYLDLMKRVLLNWVYLPKELKLVPVHPERGWKAVVARLLRSRGMGLHYRGPDPSEAARLRGKDWPHVAHTMVGLQRLDNLHQCLDSVVGDGVPGDMMETGVWRGGSCIFTRAYFRVHGIRDRVVWLADSFQGLPAPDFERYPKEGGSDFFKWNAQLAVSREEVEENFRRYGLLDDQVRFIQGWFDDTLPSAPVEQLAVLRLDGDMYGSTMVALRSLYPKVSPGGFVIVDDYTIPECQRAVHDFRTETGIGDPIAELDDGMGAFWRKAG